MIFKDLVLSEFKSWDEILLGDKLVWCRDGKVLYDYLVSFERLTDYEMFGSNEIGDPDDDDDYDSEGDGWSRDIYPTKSYSMICGWMKVVEEVPYDPTQMGDQEDDI